jgi:hypothetical protein
MKDELNAFLLILHPSLFHFFPEGSSLGGGSNCGPLEDGSFADAFFGGGGGDL